MAGVAKLAPVTRSSVRKVYERHQQLTKQLTGDDWSREMALYDHIQEAVRIGPKKNIMTQKRIRDLCDTYVALFSHT